MLAIFVPTGHFWRHEFLEDVCTLFPSVLGMSSLTDEEQTTSGLTTHFLLEWV
jgi:hypothetical protein